MSLSGFNGISGAGWQFVFPAGEARQRMHIRAARLMWTPVFGKSGATTRIYGNRFSDGIGAGGKKDARRGERDRAVGEYEDFQL
jgi:phosphatidylcholine synthase